VIVDGGAGARRLTVREIATLRAALRLWIDTLGTDVTEDVLIELDGEFALDDVDAERLMFELRQPSVTVTLG
jgi:hypothetical protein